jgi:hypothetical protein
LATRLKWVDARTWASHGRGVRITDRSGAISRFLSLNSDWINIFIIFIIVLQRAVTKKQEAGALEHLTHSLDDLKNFKGQPESPRSGIDTMIA